MRVDGAGTARAVERGVDRVDPGPARAGARFAEALSRAARRTPRAPADTVREARPEQPREAQLAAAPAGAGHPAPAPAPRVPELAAVARALPPVVAAAPAGSGPLALSFGRSLDVELRPGPSGIELVLRPEPRLLRAAEAELPRLVEALRQRGVAIAAAAVRPRAGGRAR